MLYLTINTLLYLIVFFGILFAIKKLRVLFRNKLCFSFIIFMILFLLVYRLIPAILFVEKFEYYFSREECLTRTLGYIMLSEPYFILLLIIVLIIAYILFDRILKNSN
jgi:hypothetical protein